MAERTEPPASDGQRDWLNEIARAERRAERWRNRCRRIEKKYAQQASEAEGTSANQRQYAILWANTEVIRPAMYSRPPAPVVSRRFRNANPVARTATIMLERAIGYTLDAAKVHDSLLAVRDDLSLVARGTMWFRYEADTHDEPAQDEAGQPTSDEMGEPVMRTVLDDERIVGEYVHWDDFLHSGDRNWPEVWWAARKVYLTDEAGTKRFGDKWEGAQLDHRDPSEKRVGESEGEARATVYEIWSKRDSKVYFVAKSAPDLLEEREPLLKLDGFFPCPRPAFGTLTTGSLEPTPDYVQYQDQADEVDRLTRRIKGLVDNLKLNGFYPGGPKGEGTAAIERILQPGVEFKMIAIPGWQAFADKGGVNAIQWFPVDVVIKTIQACVAARRELIQDIFEIGGISDIMRGSTEASETLGAQQLKSQWGSSRIRSKQGEMGRFGRDCCRIIAEIVADVFDPATIMSMTDMQLPSREQVAQQQAMQQAQAAMAARTAAMMGQPPPPPAPPGPPSVTIDDVMELLRNDRLRGFVIDVETDSTVQPDEDAEKQRRIEFLTAVGEFVANMEDVLAKAPEFANMAGQFLLFGVRGFRVGKEIEEVVEQTIEQLAKRSAQPQPQPPDPKVVAEQLRSQAEGVRAKADVQTAALEVQGAREEHAMNMRERRVDHAAEIARTVAPLVVPGIRPQPPQVM